MAQRSCPECGKMISELADRCPGCGCPIDESVHAFWDAIDAKEARKKKRKRIFWLVVIILFIIICIIGC